MKSTIFCLLSIALFPVVFCGLTKRSDSIEYINCGDPDTDLIKINSFVFGPNPIVFPGNLTLAVAAEVKEDIIAPVAVHSIVEVKKNGEYTNVECTTDTGECVQEDVCTSLKIFGRPGLQCPFHKGSINIATMKLMMPFKLGIPGDYHMKINVSSAGRPVTCLEVYYTLEHTNN